MTPISRFPILRSMASRRSQRISPTWRGVAAAYDGYQASLAGKPAPTLDGFTGDQQFFIAFGQNWGSKARDAALRQQVMTDPHAPAKYRAATVRNIDAWYAAFSVQPGDKLYLPPSDRVRLW